MRIKALKRRRSSAAVVTLAAALFCLSAAQGYACSRMGGFSFEELFVADAIVRATAVRYDRKPESKWMTTGEPDSTVEFKIEEVLRGKDLKKTIVLNGYLGETDDFNDQEVPYRFVRRNGRSGNCFANTYKKGGQFLLFLKGTEGGYTTNISALGPSNEQVRGGDDPWVEWVRTELKNRYNY